MKIYLVGGAVRDKLLGLPVKERDWVVVGATVDDMLKLGYRQVGKEFPVFIHPKTGEEYALARMERKVKPGYQGFTFDTSPKVTLEEDLIRRDLTINAMAETPEGELIDPYHGQKDLKERVLRHVSTAFAEDPVRILRIARFLSRYAQLGFQVAPETMTMMQAMVTSGEVDALVPERVWKELERALGEKNPEKFFEVLNGCGALSKLFPIVSFIGPGMKALSTENDEVMATNNDLRSIVNFAALLHATPDSKKNIMALSNQYRVPNAFRELAILTALHHKTALQEKKLSAPSLIALFGAFDIYRRESRFMIFLLTCLKIAKSTGADFNVEWFIRCMQSAKSVDVQALIAEGFSAQALAAKLKEKRLEKVSAYLKSK